MRVIFNPDSGEEIDNAENVVPRSMILAFLLNGVLGFGFLVVILFSTGDLQALLNADSPFVQLIYQAMQSKVATNSLFAPYLLLASCAVVGMLASSSRLTWAFARDNGLPYSTFFSHVSYVLLDTETQHHNSRHISDGLRSCQKVDSRYRVPLRAILLNAIIAMLLSVINIASSTAFNAIISLTTISLYISYLLPVILMTLRRLKGHRIAFGPFTLGRYGLVTNLYSIVWGIFACVFVVFPTTVPVTAENMNYASLVFGGAMIFSGVAWFVYGKDRYHGPISELPEGEITLV